MTIPLIGSTDLGYDARASINALIQRANTLFDWTTVAVAYTNGWTAAVNNPSPLQLSILPAIKLAMLTGNAARASSWTVATDTLLTIPVDFRPVTPIAAAAPLVTVDRSNEAKVALLYVRQDGLVVVDPDGNPTSVYQLGLSVLWRYG